MIRFIMVSTATVVTALLLMLIQLDPSTAFSIASQQTIFPIPGSAIGPLPAREFAVKKDLPHHLRGTVLQGAKNDVDPQGHKDDITRIVRRSMMSLLIISSLLFPDTAWGIAMETLPNAPWIGVMGAATTTILADENMPKTATIATPNMVRTAPIMDLAGVLKDDTTSTNRMVATMEDAYRETNSEIQVLIVDKVAVGYTPKRMATTLFNRWRLGSKAKNNGVLVLVVLDQRRVEIEVGRGLDDYMDSTWCTQTLQETAVPAFKNAHYGTGLAKTLDRIEERLVAIDRKKVTKSSPNEALSVAQFGFVGLSIWSVAAAFESTNKVNVPCPNCNAGKETWDYPNDFWTIAESATDKRPGKKTKVGVCMNCGYKYTLTKEIPQYDGRGIDSDGNDYYYYESSSSSDWDSDDGGSSDGGGGGADW